MSHLPKAFVTLLTDASYLPGALVLLHSLRELHPAPRDFKIVCLVTPETVDPRTIGALRAAGYDLVIGVEPIASGASGEAGLDLMGRPDLNLALTKLHLFRLGSLFSKIVYLDADTLPLRPLDGLFALTEGHKFSACPDIGWPDCFNSGVMVIHPQESDFDALQSAMTASADNNGSFDGADQGLLNQYFSEDGPGGQWNRLPFTYNVTPSAAYQYAPAYKHYQHKINLIHFIGSNKPWSNLKHRAASSAEVDKTAFDYNSLVDRWYNVYDRNIRPTAVHEPNLAKRFTVPEHIAVWNQAGPPPPQHDRLNLDELKAAAEKGIQQTGQYTSLPLEGRVDLIAPRPPPRPAPQQQAEAPGAPQATGGDGGFQYPPQLQSVDRPIPEDTSGYTHHPPVGSSADQEQYGAPGDRAAPQLGQADDTRHDKQNKHHIHQQAEEQGGHGSNGSSKRPSPPPQDTWDASKFAPPRQSRPEMVIPMKTVYTPAWDEPVKSQRTYFQTQATPVNEYPSLPANVQKSDWYKHFTVTSPSRENVVPVFPWEEKADPRPAPSRSFPKEEQSLPLPPLAKKPVTAGASKVSPPLAPLKIPKPPTSLPTVAPSAPPPARAPPATFEEAMASYTNAWDDVASIGRYAKRLTALGIGVDRRNTSGIASALPSPHHSTQDLPDTSSATSRDGDDEDEGGSYGNAQYHDKHAQTDHPRLSDAEVQASPELSPPHSPQDKEVKITLRKKRAGGARSNFPDYNFASPRDAPPRGMVASGRVWDPRTDIEARRQDAQHVLSRFVKTDEKQQQ